MLRVGLEKPEYCDINGRRAAIQMGGVLKVFPFPQGCSFFAYSWKIPAYSGAFLLTVDNFSSFTHSWSFFAYSFSFLTYSFSFFAYSGKVLLIRALGGL